MIGDKETKTNTEDLAGGGQVKDVVEKIGAKKKKKDHSKKKERSTCTEVLFC